MDILFCCLWCRRPDIFLAVPQMPDPGCAAPLGRRITGGRKLAKTIGNPLSWLTGLVSTVFMHLGSVTGKLSPGEAVDLPEIRQITMDDIRDALRLGFADFKTFRSDVIFVCFLYPIIGGCLVWMVVQGSLLPLLFPVMSGFALIGPLAAVGLYEMSRRREKGLKTNWLALGDVLQSPTFGVIFVLGLFHIAIFVIWIMSANFIYAVTLGPELPTSVSGFVRDVLTTGAGWALIGFGCAIGLAFAVIVLAVSVVSFPLLLDRDVGLPVAIITSVRVTTKNPKTITAWGLIVAGSLVIGSLPMLLGLVVAMPVLGHATWHLYRKAVVA